MPGDLGVGVLDFGVPLPLTCCVTLADELGSLMTMQNQKYSPSDVFLGGGMTSGSVNCIAPPAKISSEGVAALVAHGL